MAVWQDILGALWLFLPAFVANMSPVFSAKLFPRLDTPIDFGAMHPDGRRQLGKGKTWRGLIGGMVAGALTALAMGLFAGGIFDELDLGRADGTSLWAITLFGGVVGYFALLGDVLASYAKRRSGRESGSAWFPVDQLDFVVAALAAIAAFHPLLADGWVWDHYFTPWTLGTLLVGTPMLHLLVNRVGYWLKLKEVPW